MFLSLALFLRRWGTFECPRAWRSPMTGRPNITGPRSATVTDRRAPRCSHSSPAPAPPPPTPTTHPTPRGMTEGEIPHAQAFASLVVAWRPSAETKVAVLPLVASPRLRRRLPQTPPPAQLTLSTALPFPCSACSSVPVLPRFSVPQNPITTPAPPEEQLPCRLLRVHMVVPASA